MIAAGLDRAELRRFNGAMSRDPYIREKFTRERTAAKRLAAEYFQRWPGHRRGRRH